MPDHEFRFDGPVIEWRGPAPFHFVEIPVEVSEDIKLAARGIEYWGQVPVTVEIDKLRFTTALWPKDGRDLLPVKDAVRRPLGLELGMVVDVGLTVGRD